jgi:hypothetical protein
MNNRIPGCHYNGGFIKAGIDMKPVFASIILRRIGNFTYAKIIG